METNTSAAKRKPRLILFFMAAFVFAGLIAVIWLGLHQLTKPKQIAPPDFGAISNVKEKKKAFFSFVLPMVERSNDMVMQERNELNRIAITVRQGDDLTEAYTARLDELAVKYRSHAQQTPQATIDALNKRIDTIPTSLALAQAANESAWGTARFALQGNNYFGIWCWTKNCGLVPEARSAGAKHEVASFSSVQNSIDYYILMLNSHPAYAQLREIRYTLRQKNLPITGTSLSQGLLSYSERREQYVEEINAMIRINDLETRTDPGEAGD